MQSRRVIHVVGCHAQGEVGDVIVGGVMPPPGDTLWEQRRFIHDDGELRDIVLNEPRGGVHKHVNLLVPPRHPQADMGWIIMEPMHTPPMSGSNAMCVATVLLETGIVPMTEPETTLTLEAPGGLVSVVAQVADGRVLSVRVTNVPSFVDRHLATLEVEGYPTLTVDTAYGGDSFVIVDAGALGFAVRADEAADIVSVGQRITRAANDQLGFRHPENPDWNHISFCQFARPLERIDGLLTGANACVIEPGKVDRSPTGTGMSARMALLHARGELAVGEAFRGVSIIGSTFDGCLEALTEVGGQPAVIPSIAGRAFITGTSQIMVQSDDPWPRGYRVGDTWPGAGAVATRGVAR
jgi:proline racemase